MKSYSIFFDLNEQNQIRRIEFCGKHLAQSSDRVFGSSKWQELDLYRTMTLIGRVYVCSLVEADLNRDPLYLHYGELCTSPKQVIRFFGESKPALALYDEWALSENNKII